MQVMRPAFRLLPGLAAALFAACKDSGSPTAPEKSWSCVVSASSVPNSSAALGCAADFEALSSPPLDASIPGAVSLKTVVDLQDGAVLHFQNSKKYKIHWEFASANLSGNGRPPVPSLSQFNLTEYYSPNRRFILGTLTHYAGPDVWAWELSPYDNASAAMIELAFEKVKDSTYFGKNLKFHPTSLAVENEARKLPASVPVITTDQLFAGIDYQPLNYGTSYGRLVFTTAAKLETEYVGFRDIVVLDAVPNDISVTSGIITQEFQTPLSHINVLSQNRGTPNMGLRLAHSNKDLRALEGKWVKFTVEAFKWSVTEATQAEADAWWDQHKPATVGVPNMDTATKDLRDVEEILDIKGLGLGPALKKAIPAFGGKTSHFSAFPHMDSSKIFYEKAFGIPVYYYWQHMQKNGLNDTVDKMLADPAFKGDPAVRDARLKSLRQAIEKAPIDSAFWRMLNEKLDKKYPGVERIRFRSSTNAEDLDGFTGAGLYESRTGGRTNASDPVGEALTEVWASVWYFRAFEERSYRNIDHKAVGMSILVHNAHPEEEANGVAITNNVFDPEGLEPGFYVNVQVGDESVVQPAPGVTTDQFLYHFEMPGQPIVFMAKSSLVPTGSSVLTTAQTHSLGTALQEIHRFFGPLYGKDKKWWAMDTEFKLDQTVGDAPGTAPRIIMKQARPYPGWGKQE